MECAVFFFLFVCLQKIVEQMSSKERDLIRGIGFSATCSLVVVGEDEDGNVSVCCEEGGENAEERDVILW